MTNAEAKSGVDGLTELLQPDNRLPVVDLLRATRALKAFSSAYEAAEEVRLQLVKEHGTADGDAVTVEEANLEAFMSDYVALMESSVGREVDFDSFSLDGAYTKTDEGRVALDVSASCIMALDAAGLLA